MKRMREQNDLPQCLGSKSYARFNHEKVWTYLCRCNNKNNVPVCYLFHLDVDRQPLLACLPLERSHSSRRTRGRMGVTRTSVHESYAYATDLFFLIVLSYACDNLYIDYIYIIY
jgi:hypothetical protein